MRLRTVGLIVPLALGLLTLPLPADTQAPAKVARIGVLANDPWPPFEGLRQGLRELGYIDGQNIAFEYRWAEGRSDRFASLAADLVRLKVDVIVTWGTAATLAAKQATSTIPVVMGAVGDPMAAGVVSNLARPGGNITGLASLSAELEAKRLELLKELVPHIRRVVLLWNPTNPYAPIALKHIQVAAQALSVKLEPVPYGNELESAFARIAAARPDAVLLMADPFLVSHRVQIADFMARSRLPAAYTHREYVDVGGLMAYAPNYHDLFRRAATYVQKILKGAKPGDLPVEQPTRFELVINLKTAKALGLTIPQSVLIRADEVIQ